MCQRAIACEPAGTRQGLCSIQRQSKSMPVQSSSAHSRLSQRCSAMAASAAWRTPASRPSITGPEGDDAMKKAGWVGCCTVALGRYGGSEYVADAHVSAPASGQLDGQSSTERTREHS